jgi:hypothetical protein
MVPPPVAFGLTLCDYALIEEGTRRVSLIGTLTKLTADRFPLLAPPFYASAALTEGLGDATIDLVATRLDSGDEVYTRQRQVHFSDRLRELQVIFRIADCSFPAPGVYQFTLLVDGEWLAQRRLHVVSTESIP